MNCVNCFAVLLLFSVAFKLQDLLIICLTISRYCGKMGSTAFRTRDVEIQEVKKTTLSRSGNPNVKSSFVIGIHAAHTRVHSNTSAKVGLIRLVAVEETSQKHSPAYGYVTVWQKGYIIGSIG